MNFSSAVWQAVPLHLLNLQRKLMFIFGLQWLVLFFQDKNLVPQHLLCCQSKLKFKNVDSCSEIFCFEIFLVLPSWINLRSIFIRRNVRSFSWPWEFEGCPLCSESWSEVLRKQYVEILIFSAFVIAKIGAVQVKAFGLVSTVFYCRLLMVHLHSKRKPPPPQRQVLLQDFTFAGYYLLILETWLWPEKAQFMWGFWSGLWGLYIWISGLLRSHCIKYRRRTLAML